MSKPNPAIVEAILDSYLTIRAPLWKLVNPDCTEVTIPAEEKARLKALAAARCIADAKKCESIDDWVKYIENIYKLELAEMKEGNDKWFIVKWVTDVPLLGYTLTAVRAYILSEIQDEKYQTSINDQLHNLDAFKSNMGYHHQYFEDITKGRDHRGLREKSFDDFKNNVICERRKSDVAHLLLSTQKKPETELAAQLAAQQAAEKAQQEKAEEEARYARIEAERQQALENERKQSFERAKREEERRAIERANHANHMEETRRLAEKARHDAEQQRLLREAELRRIHDEEERVAKVKAQEAAAMANTTRTPRNRRKSVLFDPTLFSQTSNSNYDPQYGDSNSSSSAPRRRTNYSSRRSNG